MFKIGLYSLIKQKTFIRNFSILEANKCYFNPKNDIAFKKGFWKWTNFKNSLLRWEGDDTIEVQHLPQELPKLSILDVNCHDRKGNRCIVEMQNKKH
jgi:hypothetical protein